LHSLNAHFLAKPDGVGAVSRYVETVNDEFRAPALSLRWEGAHNNARNGTILGKRIPAQCYRNGRVATHLRNATISVASDALRDIGLGLQGRPAIPIAL